VARKRRPAPSGEELLRGAEEAQKPQRAAMSEHSTPRPSRERDGSASIGCGRPPTTAPDSEAGYDPFILRWLNSQLKELTIKAYYSSREDRSFYLQFTTSSSSSSRIRRHLPFVDVQKKTQSQVAIPSKTSDLVPPMMKKRRQTKVARLGGVPPSARRTVQAFNEGGECKARSKMKKVIQVPPGPSQGPSRCGPRLMTFERPHRQDR